MGWCGGCIAASNAASVRFVSSCMSMSDSETPFLPISTTRTNKSVSTAQFLLVPDRKDFFKWKVKWACYPTYLASKNNEHPAEGNRPILKPPAPPEIRKELYLLTKTSLFFGAMNYTVGKATCDCNFELSYLGQETLKNEKFRGKVLCEIWYQYTPRWLCQRCSDSGIGTKCRRNRSPIVSMPILSW